MGAYETNLTLNNEYIVLNFVGSGSSVHAIIIDDNGNPYITYNPVSGTPSVWQLISVSDISSVQIYP